MTVTTMMLAALVLGLGAAFLNFRTEARVSDALVYTAIPGVAALTPLLSC
ncbi:MAG: hypothetical protein AAF533_26275 [Acidobacteriota bacterium]